MLAGLLLLHLHLVAEVLTVAMILVWDKDVGLYSETVLLFACRCQPDIFPIGIGVAGDELRL